MTLLDTIRATISIKVETGRCMAKTVAFMIRLPDASFQTERTSTRQTAPAALQHMLD